MEIILLIIINQYLKKTVKFLYFLINKNKKIYTIISLNRKWKKIKTIIKQKKKKY
jgi:hypothetical protein